MADGFGTAQMTPEKLRGTQCKQVGEDTKGSCPALEQLCSAVLAVAESLSFMSHPKDRALLGTQFLAL